jgi:hypothetical protein
MSPFKNPHINPHIRPIITMYRGDKIPEATILYNESKPDNLKGLGRQGLK